jgi:hypothetical protein
VRAPGAQQALHAAATDVDQVLFEQALAEAARLAALLPEQGYVRRQRAAGEGAVEAGDVVVGVAAGRRQEADLGRSTPVSDRT